jgi:opacity protein-like surface antigen
MKKFLSLAVALTAVLIPAVCMAFPPRPGPYVSGFIGVSAPQNSTATGFDFISVPNTTFDERVEFDPGINIGGTLGYDFGFIRMEGELSYKYSEIKSVTENASGSQFVGVDGNLGVFAMMFNSFFDFHNYSPITPYFGGGIGFAFLHLSDTFGTNPTTGQRGPLYLSDDDSVFAYQAGAGMAIALNPRLSLDLGYRFFGTSTASFGTDLPIKTDMKFQSHNGVVAVRMKF